MKTTSTKLIKFVSGLTLVGKVKTLFKDHEVSSKSIKPIGQDIIKLTFFIPSM